MGARVWVDHMQAAAATDAAMLPQTPASLLLLLLACLRLLSGR